MSKQTTPVLNAICDAIAGIESATAGKTFEDFCADWLLRHGVQRGIEIISEASRRLIGGWVAPAPSRRRQQLGDGEANQ